ncbi:hypothetical protein MAR_033717, partial [Mya arenaria]
MVTTLSYMLHNTPVYYFYPTPRRDVRLRLIKEMMRFTEMEPYTLLLVKAALVEMYPVLKDRLLVKMAAGECTEGEVYLYMYGSKGDSGKIIVHGTFEPGDEDHTMGHFVDVRKISKIQLGVKARSLAGDGWIPESVLIIDVSRKEYYKFIHGAEIDDTSIFLYPL